MFDQAVQAGEAVRSSGVVALVPALHGCAECGTVAMISGPIMGVCEDCGVEHTQIRAEDLFEKSAHAA
jgi:hypothetical protein